MTLCSLSDVKTMLGISSDDTSNDAKLNLMIKQVSAKIEAYLGYKLAMSEYTDELHSVNNDQLLQLNALPIRSVSSVTANGGAITDYMVIPKYAKIGMLYRGNGWTGNVYVQGFEYDYVSGAWEITVTYTAGYYLPGDENYVEGAEDSLPYDIVTACISAVCIDWNYEVNKAKGMKSHSEGGISDSFGDDATSSDLSDSVKKMLSKYCFYGIA